MSCGNNETQGCGSDPEDSCCDGTGPCNCENVPEYKMCKLTQPSSRFDLEKVSALTSNPKYICKCCGRTANEKHNLCSPVELRRG